MAKSMLKKARTAAQKTAIKKWQAAGVAKRRRKADVFKPGVKFQIKRGGFRGDFGKVIGQTKKGVITHLRSDAKGKINLHHVTIPWKDL